MLRILSFIVLTLHMVAGRAQNFGVNLGPFVDAMAAENISGIVHVADDTHIVVEHFYYSAKAPDMLFWGIRRPKVDGVYGRGIIIPNEKGNYQDKLDRYGGETILLELPSGIRVSDLQRFTLWCRQKDSYFGFVDVPSSISPPQPQVIGQFTSTDETISSGMVVVRDKSTIIISDLFYSGLGPDVHFIVGNSYGIEVMVTGRYIKLSDENGRSGPLLSYNGETVPLRLPAGMSISDQKYLAMYCEEEKIVLAYVKIPCNLIVPLNFGEVFVNGVLQDK